VIELEDISVAHLMGASWALELRMTAHNTPQSVLIPIGPCPDPIPLQGRSVPNTLARSYGYAAVGGLFALLLVGGIASALFNVIMPSASPADDES